MYRLRGFEQATGLISAPINDARSNLGMVGAYALTPDIFEAIEKTAPGKNGEV